MLPREIINAVPLFVRPNTTNIGFGVFLAANATIVMGGVFPFLPISFQTSINMFSFYLAQSLSFGLLLLLTAFSIIRYPDSGKRFFYGGSVTYFFGCCSIIAMIYSPRYSVEMLIVGGILLGMGSAMFHVSWQRVLASQESAEGNRNLIVGTMFSAIIYFTLYLVPIAVTHLLITFVFLPLFTLCLVLEIRKCDFNQPMFTDVPARHFNVYRKATKDYWRSALCIGSIGLASGVIRSIVITEPSIGPGVNSAALIGSFIAALGLLFLWRKKAIKFNVTVVFRAFFPFMIIGFVVLPFLNDPYAIVFSSLLYMAYNFANMLILMQCAQSSRDRGINPAIIYGFFGGFVIMMHDAGFVSGYSAEALRAVGLDPHWAVALIAVALLAIAYFIGNGGFSGTLFSLRGAEQVELIEYFSKNKKAIPLKEYVRDTDKNDDFSKTSNADTNKDISKGIGISGEKVITKQIARSPVRDRLSLQCVELQKHYRLTDREKEVMEYLARGWSMRAMAEELFVSENTIRAHSKHIYAKLAIHKRQELRDLLDLFSYKRSL